MEVTFLQNARIEYIIIIKAFQQIKVSSTYTKLSTLLKSKLNINEETADIKN